VILIIKALQAEGPHDGLLLPEDQRTLLSDELIRLLVHDKKVAQHAFQVRGKLIFSEKNNSYGVVDNGVFKETKNHTITLTILADSGEEAIKEFKERFKGSEFVDVWILNDFFDGQQSGQV
jgi:hypothetical protein